MPKNEKNWACPWCAEKDKRIKELEEQVRELIEATILLKHYIKGANNDEEK